MGNKINHFNGQINQSNYLQSTILDNSLCLFKHLDPSLNSDLSCNYMAAYEYSATNSNNLLYIDISGKVFNNDCNNLFYTNNSNIKYSIDLSRIIQKNIDNEIKLYDLSCNNKY